MIFFFTTIGELISSGYSNWGNGQPSCGFFCMEDCGVMRWKEGGRWVDYHCSALADYSFVCQFGESFYCLRCWDFITKFYWNYQVFVPLTLTITKLLFRKKWQSLKQAKYHKNVMIPLDMKYSDKLHSINIVKTVNRIDMNGKKKGT